MRVSIPSVILIALSLCARAADKPKPAPPPPPLEISGRYPHLAMYNHEGECGTGAVVPWAGRLWVITYAPHKPQGSDDRLYDIDDALRRTIHPESVGGTPADRMIHRDSKQLIIGPYFIDEQRKVRGISPQQMPGRITAAARHLTDPADRVYLLDMEGTLYDVDVHSLAVKKLFDRVAPGAHAKGGYTSQGRLVIANNGNTVVNKASPALDDPDYAKDPEAAGVLAEWDGKTWTTVDRRQFTDVTGPGGIEGAPGTDSPLWAIGWDKRSAILKLLDGGKWSTFRFPIADYSYVAKHGWYTEWPRIREVGGGKLLMNFHGGWFEFPRTFSAANTAGIRPIADYLKITADFCHWHGRLVFGCDDDSFMDNPLGGQSQSNLWFTTWDDLAKAGRPSGFGGPWVGDAVKAGEPSAPFLVNGYAGQRVLHLSHDSAEPVEFTIEFDAAGDGQWKTDQTVTVDAKGYAYHVFPTDFVAQWVRLKVNRDCTATAYFHFGPGGGAVEDRNAFAALADTDLKGPWSGGTLRPLGGDAGTLLFDAHRFDAAGQIAGERPLEVNGAMQYQPYGGKALPEPKSKGAAEGFELTADEASLILLDHNHRYRLPRAESPEQLPSGITPRAIREVVTERLLLNAGGSFFVLPRPSAGGGMRLKPVATHHKRITDYCAWRGLVVLAGCRTSPAASGRDGHYFSDGPNNPGLWAGDVDDLWKLGKPVGRGGPWMQTSVEKDQTSDPYLMTGYDRKSVEISTDAAEVVHVDLEVDFLANGTWKKFHTFEVPAGQSVNFEFPAGYAAHWIRARCDTVCKATVQFDYQ